MSRSAVQAFTDVDRYRAAIRPAYAEFVVTGRGLFTADATQIDLSRVWLQEMRENLPRSWLIEIRRPRQAICFSMEPGPAVTFRGIELQQDEVTLLSPSSCGWQKLSGPSRLASMSLAVDDITALGASLTGRDLPSRPDCHSLRASPPVIAKLRRLHAAATYVARTAPEVIANPDAARGLDHVLADAMIDCLAQGQFYENTVSQCRHAAIIQRFRRLLEDSSTQVLYLSDVCASLGVSARTLQVCCQEHLGITPKHYLILRRMHQARRTLVAASPASATVTDIATQFGFWELGRFAVRYKQLFNESPLATLRAPPS